MAEQNIRPRNFTDTATDSDLQNADNFLWLDTENKAKKVEITRLAVVGETAATEADLVAGSKLPIMTANGPKSLPGNTIAKASEQAAIATYAQNVAHSIAPSFDATRTSENPYKADEIVTYTDGKSYRFKVDHYGAWNASDVERYDAGESLKFFVVTNNPEYLYTITDKVGRFLFGIKKGGGIEWAVGVPLPVRRYVDEAVGQLKNYTDSELSYIITNLANKVDKEVGKSLIDSIFASGVSIIENPEYLYAITDYSSNLLLGIKKDGDVFFGVGVPSSIKSYIKNFTVGKVDKEAGKSLINSTFANGVYILENPEYINTLVDALNRVIIGVKKDGGIVFMSPVSFSQIDWDEKNLRKLGNALQELGIIRGVGDLSDKSSAQIPMPDFCVLNVTNILKMPVTKIEDAHAILEFWDNAGNYFKKNIIANAQGTSSLDFVKKNVSFDICNDEWVGDDTFKIKFGEWVEQDSFHLKAYYSDFFRGISIPAYNFYKKILDTRGLNSDRTWKLALGIDHSNFGQGLGYGQPYSIRDRFDDGALCFPQGFPALVYLNGEFYGVFAFNLKKHRDNYHMKKSNTKHIHLDGILGEDFFSGNIDWTDFEVRNPKDLICMDGTKYDGDNPSELIDPTSNSWDPNNSKHVNTYAVKQRIVSLSTRIAEITSAETTEAKKALFEKYFCSDNLIDYQIFSDILRNTDGFRKNWQWTTWDGERWFVNAYDLDETYGAFSAGVVVFEPLTDHYGQSMSLPSGVMQSLYETELNERYAELRNKKVIDAKVLADDVATWCKTIGQKFFELEFEKWADTPCNRDMVVADSWELVLDENGAPLISYSVSHGYSPSTTYHADDVVQLGVGVAKWYYNFKCVAQEVQGVLPIERYGFRDNLWRVANWLRISVENMDLTYNYTEA